MPVIINGSTGISGTDGSASTPAVQGTDTNTGMFFPAADQIAFAEGGTEVMRIDASGNVGIGTSSPGAKFQVAGTSGSAQARLGTAASGYLEINAFDASPVYCVVGGNNHSAAVFGTQSNTPTIFFSNNTERARITSGGDLRVGTTGNTPNGKVPKIYAYQVAAQPTISTYNNTTGPTNQMTFNNPNGEVGTINTDGSSTFFATSSDYRLKENITPLTAAAARVQALKPSRFNFIADPDRTLDGFIAHEAAEVVPEAVFGEKDAVNEDGSIKPQGIDHSKLVPLLTAALQEALSKIEALEARVAALETPA